MSTDSIDRIKRLTIAALVSDDALLDLLVLKGGNALDLFYGILPRSSLDVDFSIDGDFTESVEAMQAKFSKLLAATFSEHDLVVFDVQFERKPLELSPEFAPFWGGYRLHFKVISAVDAASAREIGAMRQRAISFGATQQRKFCVDFSRFEVCSAKQAHEVDGLRVYVYTPALLAIEKLRAICQQMEAYRTAMRSPGRTPRPRDFVDIHALDVSLNARPRADLHRELIQQVFAAKRVPLSLLDQIRHERAFHETGFQSVLDTIKPGHKVRGFDFYFDHVCLIADGLKPLWHK